MHRSVVPGLPRGKTPPYDARAFEKVSAMAELRDPSKPPGWVEMIDGKPMRNDGIELKPARENRWYVLMTIAGEIEDGLLLGQRTERVAKNRRYWNAWACSEMSMAEREGLADQLSLDPAELKPWTDDERAEVARVFDERIGAFDLPAPDVPIDLSQTYFFNEVALAKWIFTSRAFFQSATFRGSADFERAAFRDEAVFDYTTFHVRANFEHATVELDADFEGAVFIGNAVFQRAIFRGDALFDVAAFSLKAFFGSARFRETAYFRGATFSQPTFFENVTFEGAADFGSATFSQDVYFTGATIGGYASFGSATFSGIALFGKAAFSEPASFEGATFSGEASFASAAFSGPADFDSATFSRDADFSDEGFGGKTIFSDTRFLGDVPKFYQRQFHADTDFTSEEQHRKINWPRITKANARRSKRAYTRLAQVMSQLHKPDDEQFFRRQELRCKAMEGGRWHRLTFKLYEWLSLYGYSYERPLGWLGASILAGAAAIRAQLPFPTDPTLPTAPPPGEVALLVEALGISFSNTFSFLGFGRKFHPDFHANAPAWLDAISALQTILGVVFLFFLGLGLRNRFRLK